MLSSPEICIIFSCPSQLSTLEWLITDKVGPSGMLTYSPNLFSICGDVGWEKDLDWWKQKIAEKVNESDNFLNLLQF